MKNRSNKGFSLAEVLLAVALLILMTAAATVGISSAVNSENKVVDEANAQLLMSTCMIELRNEMTGAAEIQVEDGVITYRSDRTGNYSSLRSTDSGIIVSDYINNGSGGIQRRLVSRSASTTPLEVTYSSVSLDADGLIIFKKLCVKRGDAVIAENPEFKIRTA